MIVYSHKFFNRKEHRNTEKNKRGMKQKHRNRETEPNREEQNKNNSEQDT